MPEEHLHSEPVKLSFRGFKSRRALKNVSPLDWVVLRDAKTVHESPAFVCGNVLIQRFVIVRQRQESPSFLSEQCKSEPCLRVDTVFFKSVPKEFFSHRAGNTETFSRCFCMNDDGGKQDLYRRGHDAFMFKNSTRSVLDTIKPDKNRFNSEERITYYEKDGYQ